MGETTRRGCRRATQTTARALVYAGMHDLLPNAPLAERMQEHLQTSVRRPGTRASRHSRGNANAARAGRGGLATDVLPLLNERTLGGASDVAEASWNAPPWASQCRPCREASRFTRGRRRRAPGCPSASKARWRRRRCLRTPAVHAYVLTDADLRTAARADFERRTDGFTYSSPLRPSDSRSTCPDRITTDGSAEAVAGLESRA